MPLAAGHKLQKTFHMRPVFRLAKEGWIVPPKEGEDPGGVSKMMNPKHPSVSKALIVASKDQDEVCVG